MKWDGGVRRWWRWRRSVWLGMRMLWQCICDMGGWWRWRWWWCERRIDIRPNVRRFAGVVVVKKCAVHVARVLSNNGGRYWWSQRCWQGCLLCRWSSSCWRWCSCCCISHCEPRSCRNQASILRFCLLRCEGELRENFLLLLRDLHSTPGGSNLRVGIQLGTVAHR